MFDKLAGIEERYEEINRLLMETGNDYQRAAELNIERVDLEPLVKLIREYRHVLERLEEARGLRDSEDEDLRLLAEGEIEELQPKSADLDRQIKAMLLSLPRTATAVWNTSCSGARPSGLSARRAVLC